MKTLFKREILIPFHMADPAGIMFFGNIFALTHAAFEQWVSDKNEWNTWYANSKWIIPLRKMDVEYFKPLRAGEKFDIIFSLEELSGSSFVAQIEFFKQDICHARLHTRQVFCDKQATKKVPVPDDAKRVLGEL